MKLFRSIGWTTFAVLIMVSPKAVRSAECLMSPNSDVNCSCQKVIRGGACVDCLCTCLSQKYWSGKFREQEMMLADYIQAKESVDKSQLVNLDEVVQKAIKESSQKVDTPVKFMVKIQEKENAPPKEVEYQIETSR